MSGARTGLNDEEDRVAWARWGLAAAVTLAAHVAAVTGYLALHHPVTDLAAGPIVTVEFAPPQTEPSSQPADVTQPAEIAPAPDAVPPDPVEEPKPQPAPPVETAAAPPPAEIPPQPEPQSQAAVAPELSAPEEPMPQPEPPAPTAAPSAPAAPVVEVPPPAQPATERPKVETKITPPTRPHPMVERVDPKKPAAKRGETAPTQASKLASLPRDQDVASVGADDGQAAWRGQLIAQLQRAKRYPAAVAAEHPTGTVLLSFTMSRNGHVLARHIVHSSGSSALDQEALATVERAQPLPPFPPSMPQAQTGLTVPITFGH